MMKVLKKQNANMKREPKARKAPEERRIRKEQETRGNEQNIRLIVITNFIYLSLTFLTNRLFFAFRKFKFIT